MGVLPALEVFLPVKNHGWLSLSFLALVAGLMAAACSRLPEQGGAAKSDDPLDAGWRFACAITNDAQDRAACQERIALALLERGECDKALKLGAQIDDWHKGTVLAEAAARLAQAGRTNEAMQRTAQAEAIAVGIQDWQRDFILVRAAKAKAFLGKGEDVERWNDFYQSNRDYRGQVAAYRALALARAGQITNALAALEALADTTFLDVSSWRVSGYLLLAKEGRLSAAQTTNALMAAWVASERVPGNKRWDLQMNLAEAVATSGNRALAREWLAGVSSNLLSGGTSTSLPSRVSAALLGRLAVQHAGVKDAQWVAACARAAEPLIGQLQSIEQPAVLALFGEAWVRQGDVAKGLGYYARAMETAGRLINARPRALACVDICLSLDRAPLRHQQISAGLNRLLAGFGAAHG